jgi:putative heme-binding domain-containing protein
MSRPGASIIAGSAMLVLVQLTSAQIPEQAARGKKLFEDKVCTNCHSLEGRGTAVAPAMAQYARLSPRAIATMILSTRTELVILVKLKTGQSFPAMRVSENDQQLEVYELAEEKAVLRKLERPAIELIKDNESWKHPPATTALSDDQLADLIAYIKWASYGDRKGVSPSEVR